MKKLVKTVSKFGILATGVGLVTEGAKIILQNFEVGMVLIIAGLGLGTIALYLIEKQSSRLKLKYYIFKVPDKNQISELEEKIEGEYIEREC